MRRVSSFYRISVDVQNVQRHSLRINGFYVPMPHRGSTSQMGRRSRRFISGGIMRKNVFIVCLVLSCLVLFTPDEASASTMTGEQACRAGAQSNYLSECLGYATGNYVDGYAAAACARGAQSNYVHLCIRNAVNAYFDSDAATACGSASQSNYVHECIKAARNKWYTASEVQQCRNSMSNRVHSCFASAGSPYLGPDPVDTEPTAVCARMSGSSRTECISFISQAGGAEFFHKGAVGVCNRAFSEQTLLTCMSQISGRTYTGSEISLCAGSSSHEEAGNCLSVAGQPMFPDDDFDDNPGSGSGSCTLSSRGVNRLVGILDLIREDLDAQRTRQAKRKLRRVEGKLFDCLDGVIGPDGE